MAQMSQTEDVFPRWDFSPFFRTAFGKVPGPRAGRASLGREADRWEVVDVGGQFCLKLIEIVHRHPRRSGRGPPLLGPVQDITEPLLFGDLPCTEAGVYPNAPALRLPLGQDEKDQGHAAAT